MFAGVACSAGLSVRFFSLGLLPLRTELPEYMRQSCPEICTGEGFRTISPSSRARTRLTWILGETAGESQGITLGECCCCGFG